MKAQLSTVSKTKISKIMCNYETNRTCLQPCDKTIKSKNLAKPKKSPNRV